MASSIKPGYMSHLTHRNAQVTPLLALIKRSEERVLELEQLLLHCSQQRDDIQLRLTDEVNYTKKLEKKLEELLATLETQSRESELQEAELSGLGHPHRCRMVEEKDQLRTLEQKYLSEKKITRRWLNGCKSWLIQPMHLPRSSVSSTSGLFPQSYSLKF